MKDKVARRVITDLGDRLGFSVEPWNGIAGPRVCLVGGGFKDHILFRVSNLEIRLDDAVREIAALKESAKPVCKTCGQKVQEGFKAGQIETLAAGVKRKR